MNKLICGPTATDKITLEALLFREPIYFLRILEQRGQITFDLDDTQWAHCLVLCEKAAFLRPRWCDSCAAARALRLVLFSSRSGTVRNAQLMCDQCAARSMPDAQIFVPGFFPGRTRLVIDPRRAVTRCIWNHFIGRDVPLSQRAMVAFFNNRDNFVRF